MTESQSTPLRNYLLYPKKNEDFNSTLIKDKKNETMMVNHENPLNICSFTQIKSIPNEKQKNLAEWFGSKLPFSLTKLGIIFLLLNFIDSFNTPIPFLKLEALFFMIFWTYFKGFNPLKTQDMFGKWETKDVPELTAFFFLFLSLDPQFAIMSLAEGPFGDFFKMALFGAKIKENGSGMALAGLVLFWTHKSLFLIRFLVTCLYVYIQMLRFLLFIVSSKARTQNLQTQNQGLKATIQILEFLLYTIQQQNDSFSRLVKSTVKRLNPLKEAHSMNLSQLTAQKRILQSDIDLVNYYIQQKSEDNEEIAQFGDETSKISPIVKPIASNSCCVCMDRKPTVIFYPCLHECYCSHCFSEELNTKQAEFNGDDSNSTFFNPMLSLVCPICKRVVESTEDTRRFAVVPFSNSCEDFHKSGRLLGILETKNLLTYLEKHPEEVAKTQYFKNELGSVPNSSS